ncbi:MAG TPA: hypothetical protein VEU32_15970 [Burkholderiales bacterium]|nr:hypothetical protein [Burkholderiales bacterium]
MKKSYVLALALTGFAAFAYHDAFAQVGLGGGVVGTLGANGSASRFGGIGSGISSGATLRGEDLRQTGQLSAEARTPRASGNATIDTNSTVKPSGLGTGINAGGGASANVPVVSGSAWGTAQADVQAATPDVKDTVRDTAHKAESRRDKIEQRGDKSVDKVLQ